MGFWSDLFASEPREAPKTRTGLATIREDIEGEGSAGYPEYDVRFAYISDATRRQPGTCSRGLIGYVRQAYFTQGYLYGPIENVTSVAPGETLEVSVKTTVTRLSETQTEDSTEGKSSEEKEATTQTELVDKVLKRSTSTSGISLGGGTALFNAKGDSQTTVEDSREKVSTDLKKVTQRTAQETRRSTQITTRAMVQTTVEDESRRMIANKSATKTMTVGIRRLFRNVRVVHQDLGSQQCWMVDISANELVFPKPMFLDGKLAEIPSDLPQRPTFNFAAARFGSLPADANVQSAFSVQDAGGGNVQLVADFTFQSTELRDAVLRILSVQNWEKWRLKDDHQEHLIAGAFVATKSPRFLVETMTCEKLVQGSVQTMDSNGQAVTTTWEFPIQFLIGFEAIAIDSQIVRIRSNPRPPTQHVKGQLEGLGYRDIPIDLNGFNNKTCQLNLAGAAVLPEWSDYAQFFRDLDEYNNSQQSALDTLTKLSEQLKNVRPRLGGDLRSEERAVATDWLVRKLCASGGANPEDVTSSLFSRFKMSEAFLMPDVWEGHAKKGTTATYPVMDLASGADLKLALGWRVQLDADQHRNELLNSRVIRLVLPMITSPSKSEKEQENPIESGQLTISNYRPQTPRAEYTSDVRSSDELLRAYAKSTRPNPTEARVDIEYAIKVPVPGHFFDVLE